MVKKIHTILVLLISIVFSLLITFTFYNFQVKNVYFSPGGLQEKNVLSFYSILLVIIFVIIFFALIFILVYLRKKNRLEEREKERIKIRELEK